MSQIAIVRYCHPILIAARKKLPGFGSIGRNTDDRFQQAARATDLLHSVLGVCAAQRRQKLRVELCVPMVRLFQLGDE